MFARFLLLVSCAAPLFVQALPATVVEDPELANITNADIARTLVKRDEACPDATGQGSQWVNHDNDGTGHYTGSCGDSGHNSHHCWSDVYVTQTQVQWQPWQDCSDYIDCAHATSCSIAHTNSIQACATWSTSVGFSAGITSEVLNIGASYTSEHGGSSCTTSSNTYSLGWSNNQCHKIVATYQYVRVWGYVRRTCKSPLNGEPQRGDGDYTRGWTDWQADFPTGKWDYSGKYHCSTDASQRIQDLPAASQIYRVWS
ncbi:hypothetical protein N7539_003734 [Penicillium diatomitis]|uniref:Secreted protein n=1 Tax=Penicillium diatomitis TaxID=2819901 RepID=A0A9W9XCF8_9EURO|nr:uncharacterized protein N7539_003734 [Penicillium diatomitis]KAJ5488844.1 hypothetical protein N7539_003734 [Penicillium diatomitis]